jgi:nucleoside-diphosphate-sugar epimerase
VASVLIFGGAGFIGSALCRAFAARAWHVRAIDGLMPRTSGRAENLSGLANVTLDPRPVEQVTDLPAMVGSADLVIDAMGWTRHLEAAADPAYDLQLNLASHLPLVRACAEAKPKLTIYLGSRHQYGRAETPVITEATPLLPRDVQGIHKTAAEHHWRRAASDRAAVLSLRFGNTFGPGQPTGAGDIGLIGGLIRDALEKGEIVLYGGARRRNLLFAPDFAQAVAQIAKQIFAGFTPFNVAGRDISIGELVALIAAETGARVVEEEMPAHVDAIEVGEAAFDGAAFEALAGTPAMTPLAEALRQTIAAARSRA